MAGWEIALIIVAATFLLVNTVSLVINVTALFMMRGVATRSVKVFNRVLDYTDKVTEQAVKDLEEDEV